MPNTFLGAEIVIRRMMVLIGVSTLVVPVTRAGVMLDTMSRSLSDVDRMEDRFEFGLLAYDDLMRDPPALRNESLALSQADQILQTLGIAEPDAPEQDSEAFTFDTTLTERRRKRFESFPANESPWDLLDYATTMPSEFEAASISHSMGETQTSLFPELTPTQTSLDLLPPSGLPDQYEHWLHAIPGIFLELGMTGE